MKTALEIVNDVNLKLRGVVYTADYMSNELLYEMINEARKEAIEECAEKVRIKWIDDDYDEEKRDMNCHPEIDKQSILSLINKLQ